MLTRQIEKLNSLSDSSRIGVHQKLHQEQDKPFRVAVFVGGAPSMTFSAVMPLPEGLPEVAFSG